MSQRPLALTALLSRFFFYLQGILNLMVNTLSQDDLLHLKKLFNELDADGNGHITCAELSAAVEKSGGYAVGLTGEHSATGEKITAAELQRILQAADMDGDGTLSYNELVLTTVQRKLTVKEERMWMAFNKVTREQRTAQRTRATLWWACMC